MPETFTLDDEAGEILDSMPEPSEHAIAAAQAEMSKEEETSEVVTENKNPDNVMPSNSPFQGEKDESGEPFNPAIHATGKDGKGIRTKGGNWRRKRGAGSTVRLPASKPTGPTAEETRATQIANARAAGIAAANSVFLLGTMFGGEEWKPRVQPIDEKAMMEQAYGDYFIHKGVTDFPPGVALCLAMLTYAAPRFAMPQTQQRVSGFKKWITLRIAKRKIKKELKKRGIEATVTIEDGNILIDGKVYDGSRSNIGNDGKR